VIAALIAARTLATRAAEVEHRGLELLSGVGHPCPPFGVESGPKIAGGLNPLSIALHAPDLVIVEQEVRTATKVQLRRSRG